MVLTRLRIFYLILIPAVLAAAGTLIFTTYSTASQFRALGEQTIVESTLILAREKVEGVERYIIQQNNVAFRQLSNGKLLEEGQAWLRTAAEVTPSIRAVGVIDLNRDKLRLLMFRGDEPTRDIFIGVFNSSIRPELELEGLRSGRLKHFHRRIGNEDYLIAYRIEVLDGRRSLLFAHHDTGLIVRNELATLFSTEEANRQYNIVGQNNRRVFGPSLDDAGDYLVGHRFSSTLYGWRLQVAPQQAPELEAQRRSSRYVDVALVATALVVLLLGVVFFVFAAVQERKLNTLKGDFIANVSHELKTPLSVVRMFSELLLSGRVSTEAKQREYLEIIGRESDRLSGLIENVLDFSALERGKQKYELKPGNLTETIQGAIEAFRYRVEQEGVDVELDIEESLPPLLLDEQAIVLAVINLLDNAVKYGGGSQVTVTVKQVRDFVQVRVRDRGPGIQATDAKRMFERFYRGKQTDGIRGSGIGLALVEYIATAHGGRAWANSMANQGGGTEVSFNIPIPTEAAAALPTTS